MAHQPVAPARPTPNAGRTFILAIFIIGAVVTVIVGYLGVNGNLSGGIVGTHPNGVAAPPPLTSCQGRGAFGKFYFTIVSNQKGEGSFNGTSPGPCFAVAVGSTVSMNFSVAVGSNQSNSWALIAGIGSVTQPPVFPGAGFAGSLATTGIPQGQSHLFTFTAGSAGAFRYVSQVGDRAAAGMWGPFNVTAQALTSGNVTAITAAPTPAVGLLTNFGLRSDLA